MASMTSMVSIASIVSMASMVSMVSMARQVWPACQHGKYGRRGNLGEEYFPTTANNSHDSKLGAYRASTAIRSRPIGVTLNKGSERPFADLAACA